jgi:hypothetical protein
MEHRRASGASTRSMLHPTSLPPTTNFAPLLPRGALIAVITVFHRLVTPVAPRRGSARPMVGLSSPLTATLAVHIVESRAKGVRQLPR